MTLADKRVTSDDMKPTGETICFNVFDAIETKEVKVSKKPYDRSAWFNRKIQETQEREYQRYLREREEKKRRQKQYEQNQAKYYYPGDGSRWSDIR